MDFPVAPAIREALQEVIDGDEFGYPDWGGVEALVAGGEAVRAAHGRAYGWEPALDRVHDLANVIQGVRAVIHHLSDPGDGVVLHMPAYYPFLDTLARMNRRLVPVEWDGDGFDYERLEAELAAQRRTRVDPRPPAQSTRARVRASRVGARSPTSPRATT